ncbi:MAG: CvpA family protein [Candidatus Electronema sp. V4]|uniref:CvpA family protein n=1 Tax=Candidatus Electronema sp. V4 TaxID=3454756 RepID=UPI00405589DC
MTNINWHEISIFDYSIAGILTIFLLRGFCVGFVRQLAAAAALVGSYWLAGAYAGQVIPLLEPYLPPPEELAIRPAVLFWLSFGGLYLLVMLIFTLIGKLLKVKLLGWTDRMAGGLLGLARGAFVAALLFMLLAAVLPARHPLFEGSLTAPYLSQGAEIIRQFIRDAAAREDLRPMPPEAEEQPKPAEQRTQPPPADGTLVAPDGTIPDQGEAQLPPAPEDSTPEGVTKTE